MRWTILRLCGWMFCGLMLAGCGSETPKPKSPRPLTAEQKRQREVLLEKLHLPEHCDRLKGKLASEYRDLLELADYITPEQAGGTRYTFPLPCGEGPGALWIVIANDHVQEAGHICPEW